jgi:hypothetical protein
MSPDDSMEGIHTKEAAQKEQLMVSIQRLTEKSSRETARFDFS